MARIVVIGAGIGGMAVAARLRTKGHHVTVVEAAATHGGALAVLRRDGFTFDLGPHVLTLPAVYRDLFRKTGGPLEDSVELVALDSGTQHQFAHGALTLPGVGVGRAAQAMSAAFGDRAGAEWRTLMSGAGQLWSLTRRPVLETPLTSRSDPAPLPRDRATARILAPRHTLRDRGRSLQDRRARQLLDHYALQTGRDPRAAPGSLVTLPYVEATFGIWHVAGGLATLGDAARRRLDERGVTLQLGTRATRILLSDGQVSGVQVTAAGADAPSRTGRTGGPSGPSPEAADEVLDADIVVTDVDPAVVRHELLDRVGREHRGWRPRRWRPSAGAFHVLLAVRGQTPGVGHLSVWHPQDPDAELEAVFGRRPRLPAHPTIRACAPDDPTMRPAGHEAWTLQVTVPRHSPDAQAPGTIDWDAPGIAQRYADDLLAELAERGGPDLRDRILWREVRTPADHERRTGAPGGATHGSTTGSAGMLAHAANGSWPPGLFHVGAGAHPGPGLPLVGLSAEHVATLIGRA